MMMMRLEVEYFIPSLAGELKNVGPGTVAVNRVHVPAIIRRRVVGPDRVAACRHAIPRGAVLLGVLVGVGDKPRNLFRLEWIAKVPYTHTAGEPCNRIEPVLEGRVQVLADAMRAEPGIGGTEVEFSLSLESRYLDVGHGLWFAWVVQVHHPRDGAPAYAAVVRALGAGQPEVLNQGVCVPWNRSGCRGVVLSEVSHGDVEKWPEGVHTEFVGH